MKTLQTCWPKLRPGLPLAVGWRVLTELFRRHAHRHDLRLLRNHPGISLAGQLRLLLNPRVGTVTECTQLILNLGGPTGEFEVRSYGQRIAQGDFLEPFLMGDPVELIDRIERAMGLQKPASLSASSVSTIAMRVIAELLSATCLDRRHYTLETAWFDWSGGSSVKPWVSVFGHDATDFQAKLESGQTHWQAVYLEFSGLLQLRQDSEANATGARLVVDLNSGKAKVVARGQGIQLIDLVKAFVASNRDPGMVAAELRQALRQAGDDHGLAKPL